MLMGDVQKLLHQFSWGGGYSSSPSISLSIQGGWWGRGGGGGGFSGDRGGGWVVSGVNNIPRAALS